MVTNLETTTLVFFARLVCVQCGESRRKASETFEWAKPSRIGSAVLRKVVWAHCSTGRSTSNDWNSIFVENPSWISFLISAIRVNIWMFKKWMWHHETLFLLDVRVVWIEKNPHEGGPGRYSWGGRGYSRGGTLLTRGDPPHERVSRTDI